MKNIKKEKETIHIGGIKMINDIDYKIDLTKPPIGPPCRLMKESLFFGLKETKQSKQRIVKWYLYIEEYMDKFKKQINGVKSIKLKEIT